MSYVGVAKPKSLSKEECPLWHKPMCQKCHKCNFWEHVRGVHPNTGAKVDEWRCTLAWQFVMQMEGNLFMYQMGSAIESLRNELVENYRVEMRLKYRDDPNTLRELEMMWKIKDAKIAALLKNNTFDPRRQLEAPNEPNPRETSLPHNPAVHPLDTSERIIEGTVAEAVEVGGSPSSKCRVAKKRDRVPRATVRKGAKRK